VKKATIFITIVLTFLISDCSYSINTTADTYGVTIRWTTVQTINGSIYNRSQIFPPEEGNGVIYETLTNIKANVSNSVIFSLSLITIPNPHIIPELGEYFIQDNEILAIKFTIKNLSSTINYSDVIFTLFPPEQKWSFSQKLNHNSNITVLSKPIIINSSGLWKVKIEFVKNQSSEDFYVWENISSWKPKKYLTFFLNSNLSYKNYYEKVIPAYTISDINGFWQAQLTNEQGKYLKDTANSSSASANASKVAAVASQNSAFWTMISALGAWIAATIAIILPLIYNRKSKKEKEEEKQNRKEIATALREIAHDLKENTVVTKTKKK
jgi:hypothetical protein